MSDHLHVTSRIVIPFSELEITYARSSGPGGQNVNKVNSKAVLRYPLAESPSLAPEIRARLLEKLAARLTREGDLLVASDRFRDQGRNREDCLEKLRAILAEAAFVPKSRKKTKPTRASKRRTLDSKRRHSEKKRQRKGFQD